MQVAIKFYIYRGAFERERELYMEPQLKAMMPTTITVQDNALDEHKTPYGYVFPPFVIIDWGQSLDEWAQDHANTDFATIFQVCSRGMRERMCPPWPMSVCFKSVAPVLQLIQIVNRYY